MRLSTVFASTLLLSATAFAVVACGGKDGPPLEGERENIIQSIVELKPDTALQGLKFSVPKAENNKTIWPQSGGSANNAAAIGTRVGAELLAQAGQNVTL